MIQRPGMYTGEVMRDSAGDMQFYIWQGSSWELYYGYGSYGGAASAASSTGFPNPYTTRQRMIFLTVDTRIGKNNEPVLAKAYLNGKEIADQTNTLGRTTFNLTEESILNESSLTFVSGDLKPIKRFRIQSRKNSVNDVTIIEIDENGVDEAPVIATPVTSVIQPTPVYRGGGGGGGGMIYQNEDRFGLTYQNDVLKASQDMALQQ